MTDVSGTIRPTDPPNIELPSTIAHDLVIFPREVTEDGIGLYDDSVSDLAKQLRNDGIDADYMHVRGNRQWIGEKGVTPTELAFIINIATNAGWDGFLFTLSKIYSKKKVQGKISRCTQAPDGTITWEWFEVEGTGEEVAKVVNQIRKPEIPK